MNGAQPELSGIVLSLLDREGVVASLWRVDDAATAELMKKMYHGILQERLSPAAALRAAQLDLMRRPRFRDPFYWAAFQLQGEWR